MHPQGVNSPTFVAAPHDGSLTFPQILDRQLTQSPHHPAYIYDDPQGAIVSITFSQYIQTVHVASRLILEGTVPQTPDGRVSVVAIFANAESISYCMMVSAIMRAGLIPFCVSPRNAAPGLADLLEKTRATAVYVSPDLKTILQDALGICGKPLAVFEAMTIDRLQDGLQAEAFEPLPPLPKAPLNSTGIILHTSGSTSTVSKPVYLSHKMVLQYASVPWSSEQDHCGQVMSTHPLPNFHGIGIFLSTWPFVNGITMAVPRPTTPPKAPNPQNALAGVIATNPDFIMSTPASIESWSEDPVGLQVMQKVQAVLYLGAQLNKRVGDTLVAKGVVLCSTYGAMEVGLVTPFFRSYGKDWEYFAVKAECNPVRVPGEDGSHLYTHAYLPSPSFETCHTNIEVDGRPGCALSDLLEQHPGNPNLHRVYGRKDDIIIFSTGSKMNPVPIEAQLNRNSLVDAAVVFGHGKPYPGVLIQLKRGFQAELANVAKRSRVLEALWASVREANETSPTHFQIHRQMVLLGDSERPFAVTSKLQPRRKVVLESYDEEIQSAYATEA